MFQQFKNIDTAFRFIRLISLCAVIGSLILCFVAVYYTNKKLEERANKVLVIANGKIFEALAQDRGKMWPIEIKDHVKMFHFYFYTLEPDDDFVKKNTIKALYLADNSAKNEHDNLRESGYYTSMIAANVSQQVEVDSIQVDLNSTPWRFKYFGKLRIVRATSTITRSLISEGGIRSTQPSDHNPHGLLIERWQVLENKDIKETNR